MCTPRRRDIYRIFTRRRLASRTADEPYRCRRTLGTWTATICVPAHTKRGRPPAANPRSCSCSHRGSVTRERARPPRNSTRAAPDTMRDPAESANSPANSSRTERINEIAHYSRATATCGEKVEGLGSAAAIACGTVLCQNKHIDWCEAQSRDPTARLVNKLL